MRSQNLPQAVTKLVQQLRARVQPLLDEVTALEVSTYGVDAPQMASVVASKDGTALASAARQGYTRVTFQCDLHGCTEIGREETVAAPVRPIHNVAVEQALVGRGSLFTAIRETFSGLI